MLGVCKYVHKYIANTININIFFCVSFDTFYGKKNALIIDFKPLENNCI